MNFTSQFFEGLITLGITAILIPLVFRVIDDRRARRQQELENLKQRKHKVFEAALAKQSKVIEAQVHFMERFAELLWAYQLAAIAVSYYYGAALNERYQEAAQHYLTNASIMLGNIRAEISKSLRLSSQQTYDELKHFYHNDLLHLDMHITQLIRDTGAGKETIAAWSSLNTDAVHTLAGTVDGIINKLALEFQFKESEQTSSE